MQSIVSNINAYLVEGQNIFIEPSTSPICHVPPMVKGNAAIDDGNFIFTEEEKNIFVDRFPNHATLIRPFMGSDELLYGFKRYCLWLAKISPEKFRDNPEIMKRIENIRNWRQKSKKAATRKFANTPTIFMENRQPSTEYLMVPVVSSEHRKYIPIGFLPPETIANYSAFILPNASLFHFSIIASEMHNIWIRYVCGKLEGRIRYSNTLGYNTFPWPENPSEKQKKEVEEAAQKVLDVREKYLKSSNHSSLADLYDPLTMPPDLVKAHQELDKAVDLCYRPQPFPNETKRIEFLFELYDKYTADLFTREKPKKTRAK